MAIHLRRPSDEDLDRLLASCRSDTFTYGPIGVALDGAVPNELTRRTWSTTLSSGGAFSRAAEALSSWEMHKQTGLGIRCDGPLAAGTNVALSAPLPVGYVDACCRIAVIVDEPGRFGFAYGTLPVHPACGEEAFVVSQVDGAVRFDITAVSRPAHPLARLAPPIAHRLQVAAIARYLHAMDRLAAAR